MSKEDLLATLFEDLEKNLYAAQTNQVLTDFEILRKRASDALTVGDYFTASRLYEDIMELYHRLPAKAKAQLYQRCGTIHKALVEYQQGQQWPAVESLLKEYAALFKIKDWKNCALLYNQLMMKYALLPDSLKHRLIDQLKTIGKLPQPARTMTALERFT